ncbi:unnamed protein product [Rotaria sp. Silwood2]|nr:unnamed protein product [Rotaria sp. Silwood2]CAF3163750.1 unnamed protein product [Rotaria sp. Silwood2]CAF4314883.1 unnamed protein product [Rotaria sp. Silwood2]CAF4372312.1 unnamed protein product [Rotaria sp. Silwood2]
MLYELNQGSTAAKITRIITGTYDEEAVDSSTYRRWFVKFRCGHISGRPVDFDDEVLEALLHADPRQTTRELVAQLDYSHMTVDRHLGALDKIHKYGKWVPQKLSTDNLAQSASICASLLSRQEHEAFLERIVTVGEKLVCCINVRRRRQWLDPGQKPLPAVKQDLHPKKIMLCIWWDIKKGIIDFELLDVNQTSIADV